MKIKMKYMRKSFLVLMLAVIVSAASCSFTTKNTNDPDKDRILIDLISYVLSKGHYDAKDLNDDFSREVFSEFIKNLDPLKRYFYASDIEEFKKYETKIDDQIKDKEIEFFDLAYTRLKDRISDSRNLYKDILSKPFNFEIKETNSLLSVNSFLSRLLFRKINLLTFFDMPS